jgi:hypothetical protein
MLSITTTHKSGYGIHTRTMNRSGYSHNEGPRPTQRPGVSRFVQKPDGLETLSIAVRHKLDAKRGNGETRP